MEISFPIKIIIENQFRCAPIHVENWSMRGFKMPLSIYEKHENFFLYMGHVPIWTLKDNLLHCEWRQLKGKGIINQYWLEVSASDSKTLFLSIQSYVRVLKKILVKESVNTNSLTKDIFMQLHLDYSSKIASEIELKIKALEFYS